MEVDGTGSNFRVAGTVDLEAGILENEMIVTLPVSKSLPWYGAYIAIANPIAGLGVLVGERVLRKPLEQFSSAKYEISGTLEDPQVKLMGVFDTSMSEPKEKEPKEKEMKEKTSDQEGPGQERAEGSEPAGGPLVQEVDEPMQASPPEIVAQPEQAKAAVTDE
jgi:hypothetical protein